MNHGAADAYYNMAIDEALLLAQIAGKSSLPVLRFYSWQPAAFSLGYAQKTAEILNEAACRSGGIDIVRRNTGGRVVYHQRELTYCMVAGADNPLLGTNIRESYAAISKALIAGLKNLRVKADFVGRKQMAKHNKSGGVCFLSPSWYEIVVGNKKLIGSAQRRTKGFILQQGSLLLENNANFFDYFCIPNIQRKELKEHWRNNTTALWELINPSPLSVVQDAIIQGMEKELTINFTADKLNAAEERLGRDLMTKYRSEEWARNL